MNAPVLTFDWKNPEYASVFAARMRRLHWIRSDPARHPEDGSEPRAVRLAQLKAYYRHHLDDFINDWGVTYDPRNADVDLPTLVPFLLFPKQRDWIGYVLRKWKAREPGLTEKSRDCGVSWLAIALGCSLCLYTPRLSLGYGSNLERNVDTIDDPKSLFFKARMFMENLPPEFQDGWDPKRDAPHMRIKFPSTGSIMTGEAGDNIGRGGRTAITFLDESAHIERPKKVDASLSATTNCRQDISSVNGMANSFAERRWGGKIEPFIFDWRDDPRKDEEWYAKQVRELDPVTLAQEVDRDYHASALGKLIPSAWVQAAVDAHLKLGIAPAGDRVGGLDVADEGKDANAFAGRHGPLLEELREWSGKGSDIFATTVQAFSICDALGYPGFKFDSDGLGAGCRGDAAVINSQREAAGIRRLDVQPFRGSEAVFNPEGQDEPGRRNKDFFSRQKAQAWWGLRNLFKNTYRAVTGEAPYDPNGFISLSSKLPLLGKLTNELAQITYSLDMFGRIVIDKMPDDTKSPNLADAVNIAYSRTSRQPMRINPGAIRAL